MPLYPRGHVDTWLYVAACRAALRIRRVLLARRLLDKSVRHAIEGDIPKFGERFNIGASQESPHGFLMIPIGAQASSITGLAGS